MRTFYFGYKKDMATEFAKFSNRTVKYENGQYIVEAQDTPECEHLYRFLNS